MRLADLRSEEVLRIANVCAVAAISVLVAGCATTPSGPSFAGHVLTGKDWQLTEITQRNAWPVQLAPAQQTIHRLRFNPDGTLQLTLDCNRGTANWSASGPQRGSGNLQISQIASTRALCPPPSYGEAMAADLPSAAAFTVMPGGRSMQVATRTNVYTFVAGGFASQLPADALVPDTGYNATASVVCTFANGPSARRCEAGVRRRAGGDGTTFVEIRKPDGRTRVIFFRGATAYGADSAQADGSAGWVFEAKRRRDESVVNFGPERYVIPDAFVIGG
jgi:heat shock protein HslJ